MPLRLIWLSFQFHKGTIRTEELLAIFEIFWHFNSIKVQLEPNLGLEDKDENIHFNSIKVQLEQV